MMLLLDVLQQMCGNTQLHSNLVPPGRCWMQCIDGSFQCQCCTCQTQRKERYYFAKVYMHGCICRYLNHLKFYSMSKILSEMSEMYERVSYARLVHSRLSKCLDGVPCTGHHQVNSFRWRHWQLLSVTNIFLNASHRNHKTCCLISSTCTGGA